MQGLPILDYAPSTLLGVGTLMVFFGLLVPYRTVKQLLQRIEYLESALAKEQAAHAETIAQNSDYQETTKLARATWQALVRRTE